MTVIGETGAADYCFSQYAKLAENSESCVDALYEAVTCYRGRYECVIGGPRGLGANLPWCGDPEDDCTPLWEAAHALGCKVPAPTGLDADWARESGYYFPECLWDTSEPE